MDVVADCLRGHLQRLLLALPQNRLPVILQSPVAQERRPGPRNVRILHLRHRAPPGVVAVLTVPVRHLPPEPDEHPDVPDPSTVRDIHPFERGAPIRPPPLRVIRRAVEPTGQAYPRLRRRGRCPCDQVHHPADRVRSVQCGSRALDDLDPLDLRNRKRVPVDRGPIRVDRGRAIHQQQHPAPRAPAVPCGSPDPDLRPGHVYSRSIGQRPFQRSLVLLPEFPGAHHTQTYGGLLRTLRPLARGHDYGRHLHRRFGETEHHPRLPHRLDPNVSGLRPVPHHQRLNDPGALRRALDPEPSRRVRRRAEHGPHDHHTRAGQRLPVALLLHRALQDRISSGVRGSHPREDQQNTREVISDCGFRISD